jgi:cation-transporting ATPase E
MAIGKANKKAELLKAIENAEPMEADFLTGLSTAQVEKRKADGLVNKVAKKVTKTYWQIFCDNFFSFFNILLFSVAILMAVAGLDFSYFFFAVILLANIFIGLFTDIRARHMVDKLRLITDPKAAAIRNGKEVALKVQDIVLSDIMILRPGDQICAGAIIVNGNVNVDESLLTGESNAIHKAPGDEVLSGSYVRSGTAYARVNKIGSANYAENLQDSAKEFDRPKSEIKRSCIKIFWVTGIIAIIVGIGMLCIDLIKIYGLGGLTVTLKDHTQETFTQVTSETFYDLMKRVSGSLVAMIPSGLYLLTSLTLAVGVINLAKKHMNVQELYCIENLARVDTICFDKTGTLTDGVLTVKEIYDYSGMNDVKLADRIGSLINATQDNNATAQALKQRFPRATLQATAVIPFDSARKFSAATFPEGTYILGAPSFIDSIPNPAAATQIHNWTVRGFRVVGLYFNRGQIRSNDIPAKSTLVALVCMSDHIKPDAKANVAWFRKNGVDVKIISGDDALTVSQIAQEVGVAGAAYYVSMEKIPDAQIPSLVETYSVFGRVRPEQKAAIISALQERGHKVAMTGDGVNDILALKKADCSIAMASGSSAARNVSHIVSMDNDFSKLPDVVAEGRRVINNLERTSSLFLSKTFFAIMVSIGFLIAQGCGYAGYPFSTKNMMIWEIVTIGGGGFFLALQPSRERIRGGFMETVLSRALPAGLVESAAVLIFFLVYHFSPGFMTADVAKSISVITFTILSYLVLFRICWPIDLYRGTVFTGMAFFGIVFFLIDLSLPNRHNFSPIFDISYQEQTVPQMILLASVLVGLGLIYFFVDFFVSFHLKRKYPELRRNK